MRMSFALGMRGLFAGAVLPVGARPGVDVALQRVQPTVHQGKSAGEIFGCGVSADHRPAALTW
jgi:hypothetical protein